MVEVPIVYRFIEPDFRVSLHKSMDKDCEEYAQYLPTMRKFIEKHKWKYAYSMPKTPHWYVCKEGWTEPEDIREFEIVARLIQKYGYDRAFFNSDIRYLNVGIHKYWTMGYTWQSTIIINRAVLHDKV